MRLYHFTSLFHLPMIKKYGLSRGDVPVSPSEGLNAVWLTSDPNPSSQNWSSGSAVDKSRVRIAVDIPENDTNLHKWSDFAKQENVPDWWYKALHVSGGGGSENWYIYQDIIDPERFIDV